EEAMFAEYSNNLLKYQDDIQKLGVEIKSVVSRTRCLYGASKFYDLRAMNKLPHFYSGHI
ncbi:MAG: hypothetical protein FWE85_05255, partial [Clostridiales bacterium]|nr:hypothetical protein [Clostridiales bacterium]